MATEPLARIQSGEITFYKEDGDGGHEAGVPLAAQQKVNIKRSVEKKQVYSNDSEINETVMEVVTKAEYEFSTEVADISVANLGLVFRGLVENGTYAVGDTFRGRTILADTVAGAIGDPVISNAELFVVKTAYAAGAFDASKCTAPRSLLYSRIKAEQGSNAMGMIIVDGVNKVTGKKTTLTIPRINLIFEGDYAFSGTDMIKLALGGKILKKVDEPLFTLEDEK